MHPYIREELLRDRTRELERSLRFSHFTDDDTAPTSLVRARRRRRLAWDWLRRPRAALGRP